MPDTTVEDDYALLMAECEMDPLRFVIAAFPWGEAGGELEKEQGPKKWQRETLQYIGDELKKGGDIGSIIRTATATGHGVGKSALVAWIVLWGMATKVNCKGVVTANTKNQLDTKTWAEVAKWHRLFIGSHYFEITATSIFSADPQYTKTWRIDSVPWSETNTEAFAGMHNKGSRIIMIFDEASSIFDKIWEVTEGALTDDSTQILWCVFGNPTRNQGRFRECFRKFSHRWRTITLDSRDVEGTDKRFLNEMVEDYGEDSDVVRVRVRGLFPLSDSAQFISADVISKAASAAPDVLPTDPLVMSIDVAREGDDESVIAFRRGKDARIIPWLRYHKISLMELADRASDCIEKYQPDAVFIDETGVGGGVIDRLRQLNHHVIGVHFGSLGSSVDGIICANKKTEMWVKMRSWLECGGAIPNDEDLKAHLATPAAGVNAKEVMTIESKREIRRRGEASPDMADALALTFGGYVGPRVATGFKDVGPQFAKEEWSPLGD